MGGTKRVTLASIANETGVSIATISKVLNGRGDVSTTTRARVEAQLHKRGYSRPGASRSDFLEIVLPELDPNWSVEVLEGVRDVAAEVGLAVSLSVGGDRGSSPSDWMTEVLRRRPVGVVLAFAGIEPEGWRKLHARGIPVVALAPDGEPVAGIAAVGSTDWQGGVAATRHLVERGHRAIAAIAGPADAFAALARLDGFRTAMRVAGLAIRPDWIRHGDFHEETGRQHGAQLLGAEARPTAIFAGDDLQALGVMRAAAVRGLAVPRDLSVVGYNDSPLARVTSPPLTTVHRPLRKMAEEATRLVLQMRDGSSTDPTRIDLSTSLVVRESTSAPADPRRPA